MACCAGAHASHSRREAATAGLFDASGRVPRSWTALETMAQPAPGRASSSAADPRWRGRGARCGMEQASEHPLVHDLVPTAPAWDGRQEDAFVRDLSIGNGRPVVGDMCMGSALLVNGTPYAHAATEDGKAIERLTRQKRSDYPELVASDRVRYADFEDLSATQCSWRRKWQMEARCLRSR